MARLSYITLLCEKKNVSKGTKTINERIYCQTQGRNRKKHCDINKAMEDTLKTSLRCKLDLKNYTNIHTYKKLEKVYQFT